MGLFIAVLPSGSAERAEFAATYCALGAVVLLVVMLRVLWLLHSPAPPTVQVGATACRQAALARAAHDLLDLALAGMSISGLWLVFARGKALDPLGLQLAWPGLANPSSVELLTDLHGAVLPITLVGLITLQLGAVLKRRWWCAQRIRTMGSTGCNDLGSLDRHPGV